MHRGEPQGQSCCTGCEQLGNVGPVVKPWQEDAPDCAAPAGKRCQRRPWVPEGPVVAQAQQ